MVALWCLSALLPFEGDLDDSDRWFSLPSPPLPPLPLPAALLIPPPSPNSLGPADPALAATPCEKYSSGASPPPLPAPGEDVPFCPGSECVDVVSRRWARAGEKRSGESKAVDELAGGDGPPTVELLRERLRITFLVQEVDSVGG